MEKEKGYSLNILITGSKGFLGKNLTENLKNIRDGKNRTRPGLNISDIFEYSRDTGSAVLEKACEKADFVFHLAGVNRPKGQQEFLSENVGFTAKLLELLKNCHNTCPVMLASSIQASCIGRYADSAYGKSKRAAEELFFQYASDTGAKALVYRFPNVFGKWCRPGYNSVVATFCHAAANGLEYNIHDRSTQLELLYIDGLVDGMLDALEGKEHHCGYEGLHPVPDSNGRFCYVLGTCYQTLGEIDRLLQSFVAMPKTLMVPPLPEHSFAKKLYSTYLSYLPEGSMSYGFCPHIDGRGNFTELIRTKDCGQVSVNIAGPGITRGQHWHNSKWEIFIVVAGHGLIQERKVGIDPQTGRAYPVHCFEVDGQELRAVQILPGYTHSITNTSQTENLVTVMWANEPFDENRPDTYFEEVVPQDLCACQSQNQIPENLCRQ